MNFFRSFQVKANKMNNLIEFKDLGELKELRQLYQKDWPKYYVGYNTLNIYISWLERNKHLKFLKIYSLNSNWRENGLFLIVDRYHLILHSLLPNDANLGTAMKLLGWKYGYKITAITKEELPIVKATLEELNIEARLFTLNTYSYDKTKALKLDIDCPKDYVLGQLDVNQAEFVHDNWPPRQKASIHFLKRLIELNPTIALYEKSTMELIGWCIRCHGGFLGSLYVSSSHRRRGLAALIIKAYARKLAENNENTNVLVYHINEISKGLFEKLDFEPADDLYHIRAYSVHEDDVWPFEN